MDPLGVAVIGETGCHLVSERQVPIHPAQQQGASSASDGTAVESSYHTAASVGFKPQRFGALLCRHWFSFQNLVNSLAKSILERHGKAPSSNGCETRPTTVAPVGSSQGGSWRQRYGLKPSGDKGPQ